MYRFAPPDKRRPVLVLSRQVALDNLHTAMVAPITTQVRGLPSEVLIGTAEGLKRPSAVNLDHIATVAKADLRKFVGSLSPEKMRAVCEAAMTALGCRA